MPTVAGSPRTPCTTPAADVVKKKCRKARYPCESGALAAGRRVHQETLDARSMSAYQCRDCRYPDGQRAWHWGHFHPSLRRRKKW